MRVWKDIPGYPGYQVSDDGYLRSLPDIDYRGRFMPGFILSASISDNGYPRVAIKGKGLKVHRAVALAFIPNPDNLPQVNHKNGVKTDNRVGNLEWCTNSQNQIHRYQVLGKPGGLTGKRGAMCKNSKRVRATSVTTGAVSVYASGQEAAREMGVDGSGISQAARGLIRAYKGYHWAYIDG